MDKPNYLAYLESYLTPRKKFLFDRVSANRTRHFTVVAEDTYQDHNASALIRSCDCFGIQDLHIIEEINRYRLAKSMAQGAEKWVDLHYYSNFENNTQTCIDNLREQGYSIIATTPHATDCFLDEFDICTKSAFFFGKERLGLSQLVLDQADRYIKIPMFGFSESFNISVSVALLLQSLTARLRKSENIGWRLSSDELMELKIKWCLKTIQKGKRIGQKYLSEHQ